MAKKKKAEKKAFCNDTPHTLTGKEGETSLLSEAVLEKKHALLSGRGRLRIVRRKGGEESVPYTSTYLAEEKKEKEEGED